ncbi:MAG: hypothetical protein WC729_29345 [Sphingomonas sp.]|jgi:hypothetical protein|uniref:hypothetical protein n=1 Tax=Sphingomonas sp. TaxID=28214 RepID=UPI00356879BC
MPVRIAMFEGIKRSRSGSRSCKPGRHVGCVKNRRAPKTAKAKAWRKRFTTAAHKCKPAWKSGRSSFNACMKKALK